MLFDKDSLKFIAGSSIIVGLVGLVVGSLDAAEARPVAGCFAIVLVPMLIVAAALVFVARPNYPPGGMGFVVFFAGMIAAVEVGNRVAAARPPAPPARPGDGPGKPDPWDEDLA